MAVKDPVTGGPILVTGGPGRNGTGAYDLWLAQGNVGTIDDYLAAQKGRDGIDGRNGKDGKDGAPGVGAYQAYTAGEPITAQTNVVNLSDDVCVAADPNNDAHRGRLAGLAMNDADLGSQVIVVRSGPFLSVTASLPPDADLFIADGTGNTILGGLTNVPPTSGWRQIVGRMTGPSSLMYQPGEPSIIQDGDALIADDGGFAAACDIDKAAQPGVTNRYVTPAANALALSGKASLKSMTSSVDFPWETIDYNALTTVLETKFVNGGASSNAPDTALLQHYLGFGGGTDASRGSQIAITSRGGGSLYFRIKSSTSWPAWVAVLTAANINTVLVTPTGGTDATPLNDLFASTLAAIAGKASLKGMNSSADFPWETVDYNVLSTVLDTKFINGGTSTNAPDSAAIQHYFGFGGGNTASRGAQMALTATGGGSLYARVKVGASWGAWVAFLTSANLSAQTITPTGGTLALSLGDLFGRTITAVDFGAVADAVEVPVIEGGVTTGYTVIGTDNAAAFNAYANWCRANGRPFLLPPGNYRASGASVELGDLNVYGAGARIYVPNSGASSNSPPKKKILFSTAPADIVTLSLDEIRQWTGWTRRSRRLQNIPQSRAGEYITVSTPWQYQLKRKSGSANSEVLFGEGFRIVDDAGRLGHTIFGNARPVDWRVESRAGYNDPPYYQSRKCKSVVTVEGLKITAYRDGSFATSAANACDAIVSVQRPFTTLRDVWLDNISGRQVLQGFNVDQCCDIRFYNCHVEGLRQANTNYGWNIGTCAGIELFGCSERFCRRGVDAHRAKHVKIMGGDYADGVGAHYAWWMGAIGANIGPAGGSDNAQLFAVSGGGCYLRSCELVAGTSTTAIARIRDDLFELGGTLAIEDCQIILQDGTGVTDGAFFIVDATGPTGGFDNNVYDTSTTPPTLIEARTVEMPRQISIRGNTIEDLDTTGRSLRPIHFLQDYSDAQFPSKIEVNTSWQVYGNTWKRALSNNVLPDGSPWLQVYYYKPPAVIGRGCQAFVADMLTCYFWIYSRVNPATSDGRIDLEIARIPGRVDVRYGIGSYRRIQADVQDFRPSIISASSGFTPNPDEIIVSPGISGGGANYPIASVAAAGGTVKYGAVGPSSGSGNIAVLYGASGTASAVLADVGQKAGFYGMAGSTQQTLVASPTADVNALKAAFDDLRTKIIATGLFLGS